ncbi:MAG TPA: hypothetical protein VJG30_00515 [Candidatus Nanoarchaeia archaeon]|nr:hypothetical protein [Candidatus Nanoarchaeia archaeon]
MLDFLKLQRDDFVGFIRKAITLGIKNKLEELAKELDNIGRRIGGSAANNINEAATSFRALVANVHAENKRVNILAGTVVLRFQEVQMLINESLKGENFGSADSLDGKYKEIKRMMRPDFGKAFANLAKSLVKLADSEIDLANSLAFRKEAQLFSLNRKLRTMAVDNVVRGVYNINRHFHVRDLLDRAVLEIPAPIPSRVLKKGIDEQKNEYHVFIERIVLTMCHQLGL